MMRVMDGVFEIWGESGLVTCSKTGLGWLTKIYDLTDPIWPCVVTFYSLGEGTERFNDWKNVSPVREVHQKAVFGRPDYTRVLRRKK